MSDRNPAISWRAIVYGVAIVYGTTFVSGLVFAFAGITPQMHHLAYPLLALYTGAVGVALALRVADTTRPSYLVAIGVGVWLLSSTSVLLGAQSVTGWVTSSAFIAATVILGRLFVGSSLVKVQTPSQSYSTLVQRATQTRRNA
jgi:hypothetical protein